MGAASFCSSERSLSCFSAATGEGRGPEPAEVAPGVSVTGRSSSVGAGPRFSVLPLGCVALRRANRSRLGDVVAARFSIGFCNLLEADLGLNHSGWFGFRAELP